MARVLVLFPPKTKYSPKLYFRSAQIVERLGASHQVSVINGVSETGTTGDRKSALVRGIKLAMKAPSVIWGIRSADAVVMVPTPLWYVLLPLCRLLGKPVLLDHFTTYLSHADYVKAPGLSPVLRRLDRILYKKFDAVLTHTATMRRDLAREYGYPLEKIHVMYSVVDTELFDPARIGAKRAQEVRNELGIPRGSKVAMYHGAYHPFHGVHVIKAAAPLLEKEGISVLLLGDPAPEAEGPKNIFYQPYTPFEQLPDYLSAADVWLGRFSASNGSDPRGERAASSCMFQAMAMGVPIVTATSEENAYALGDGAYGKLIDPEDPQALARAIIELLEDEKELRRLGKVARERILSSFTLEVADRVLEEAMADVVR